MHRKSGKVNTKHGIITYRTSRSDRLRILTTPSTPPALSNARKAGGASTKIQRSISNTDSARLGNESGGRDVAEEFVGADGVEGVEEPC